MNGRSARCLAYLICSVKVLWCLAHIPDLCLPLILDLSDMNLLKDEESVKVGSFALSQKKHDFFRAGMSFLTCSGLFLTGIKGIII